MMKDFLLLKEKRDNFGLDQVRNKVGQNEDRREYKKSLFLFGGKRLCGDMPCYEYVSLLAFHG